MTVSKSSLSISKPLHHSNHAIYQSYDLDFAYDIYRLLQNIMLSEFGDDKIVFRNDISVNEKLVVLLIGRGDCC